MEVVEFIRTVFHIILILTLIAGGYVCIRYKFIEGFLFFLMILILQIGRYIVTKGMEEWVSSPLPFGELSIGQLLQLINTVYYLLHTTAFVILVVGLYRQFRNRKNHQTVYKETYL